jgi:acetate kinase
LQREAGLSVDDVDRLLNRESGLLGLSGLSDMRDLFEKAKSGDSSAKEAIDVWAWRARHYLGAYMAQLGGLDAITFTGGIGENQGELREAIVHGCEDLGISIDHEKNRAPSRDARLVSAEESRVLVWVIPTDEELQIATLTEALTA